ncbi:MAG TPA: hypothetical protein VFF04_06335 [Candidatus Babeliales bacterium]|nr:hypothetical protein [Candidatus Babeliales bacterium]
MLGLYARIYPEHPHIANIRVYINGSQPDHSQLHHPLVAQLLIWLQKNTAMFDQLQSAVLFINEDKGIEYVQDTNREQLIENDLHLSKNILMAFRKPKKTME